MQPATPRHLTCATTFRDMPQIAPMAKALVRRIERLSNGSLTLDFKPYEAFGPPLQNFEAVEQGRLDMAFASPAYWTDRDPAFVLFSGAIPFGAAPDEHMAWLYHGGGLERQQALFARFGIVSIPAGILSAESGGWFRDKIERADQLAGRRLRFFGLGAQVVQQFGAITYGAGSRFGNVHHARDGMLLKELDGMEFLTPAIDLALDLHTAARYLYMPGWHQMCAAFDLMINADLWNDLSDHQRAVIETCCGDSMRASLAEGEALQFAALREIASAGTQILRLPEIVLNELRAAWEVVLASECQASQAFGDTWGNYATFRSGYSEWQRLTFLEPGAPIPPNSDARRLPTSHDESRM